MTQLNGTVTEFKFIKLKKEGHEDITASDVCKEEKKDSNIKKYKLK